MSSYHTPSLVNCDMMIDVKTNSKHCFLLTFISIFLTANAMKRQLFNTPSGGAHQEKKVNRSGRESKKLQQSLQVSVLLHLTLPYLQLDPETFFSTLWQPGGWGHSRIISLVIGPTYAVEISYLKMCDFFAKCINGQTDSIVSHWVYSLCGLKCSCNGSMDLLLMTSFFSKLPVA